MSKGTTLSMPSSSGGIKGVELNIICGGVPVITLEKSCVFHENVSWMLQQAMNADGKADSLFEYIEDERIVAEGRRLGLTEDEMSIVRLKSKSLRHVKAVGTTGKRSVMLAVVVALALEDPDNTMDGLWKELRAYKLGKAFVKLLESGLQAVHGGGGGGGKRVAYDRDRDSDRESDGEKGDAWSWKGSDWQSGHDYDRGGGSGGGKGGNDYQLASYGDASHRGGGGSDGWSGRNADRYADSYAPPADRPAGRAAELPEGVSLDIVCGIVPVLELDKASIFHENVSLLLQTAMDSSGKADACYEYCDDRQIMAACCRELSLTETEVGLVAVRHPGLEHIKAVGTSGKRSIMLSVVVALVLHNEVQCADLQKEVYEFDPKLYKPLDKLVRAAKQLVKGNKKDARGPVGWQLTDAPPAASKRKRVEEDDDADDWGAWGGAPAKKSAVKTEGYGQSSKGTRSDDWDDYDWQPSSARKKEFGAMSKPLGSGGDEMSRDALDKQLGDYFSNKDRRTTHS